MPGTAWSYVPKLDIFKCVVVSLFKNVHEYFLVVKSILVLFSSSAIMPSEFHGQRLTHMLDCAASTLWTVIPRLWKQCEREKLKI